MLRALSLARLQTRPFIPSRASTTAHASQTFAALLRNCPLTALGDPVGQVLVGRVYHSVGDDLYVDFGHKFGCVVGRGREGRGGAEYRLGSLVRVRVNSLELSQRFLGHSRDLSLLEADCTLLGPHK